MLLFVVLLLMDFAVRWFFDLMALNSNKMWANNKKVAWTITATASTATKNSPCNWIFLKRESTAQVSYSHRCITAINKRQMHSLRDTILDRHTVHTFTICDREQQQRHVNNTRRAWRIYKLNDWREKISSEKKKRRRLNNTQQLRNKPKAIFDELDATLMIQFFCNFVVFFFICSTMRPAIAV